MEIKWKPEKKFTYTIKPLEDPSTHLQTVRRVCRELEAIRKDYKRPKTTEQEASTLKLLAMSKEEVEKHKLRPLPTVAEAKANADAEMVFKTENKASMTDLVLHEDIRHKSRNSQGDAVSAGATSASAERKEMARQAFSFTPPADLTQAQIAKLTEMEKIKQYQGPVPDEAKKKTGGLKGWLSKLMSPSQAELTKKSWRDLYTETNKKEK